MDTSEIWVRKGNDQQGKDLVTWRKEKPEVMEKGGVRNKQGFKNAHKGGKSEGKATKEYVENVLGKSGVSTD